MKEVTSETPWNGAYSYAKVILAPGTECRPCSRGSEPGQLVCHLRLSS